MIKSLFAVIALLLVVLPLAAGADNKGPLDEALLEAAGFGDTATIKTLLEKGANVNAEDERGWSALRHAAAEGRTEVVNMLKAHGARVTLIIAAILGDTEEVQRLVSSRANIDQRDEEGCTPLVEAIRHERSAVVTYLLDHGADPNETDNGDRTALMMAALTGQLVAAKQLLAKGAYINATDIRGWTALSNAQGSEHKEVARYLRQAGAVDRGPSSRQGKKKRPDNFVTGELVEFSAERLSIRVKNTGSGDVVTLKRRLTTAHVPFRLPRVGEHINVRYREKDGTKIAEQVRIVTQHEAR